MARPRHGGAPAVRAASLWLALLVPAGCGVLATEGGGDQNLPDARLGPFRAFAAGEVSLPPMAILDFGGALGGPDVARGADGGFVMTMHAAPDDDPITVLRRMTGATPTAFADAEVLLDGEPEGLRDPDVLEEGGETLVFFGLGTGAAIGVARSGGGAFTRDEAPILEADPEVAPVGGPSVAILDGTWLLYYTRGGCIALATSTDGVTFEEQGDVLTPSGGDHDWDGAAVSDPDVAVVHDALGGTRVRLYYTGLSPEEPPVRGVGLAVSFDGRGDFHRFVGNPVVALDGDESAPTVTLGEGDDPTFLYFARTSGTGRPGIAGAVLPGDVSLAAGE